MWDILATGVAVYLKASLESLNYKHTKLLAQQRWGRNGQIPPWVTSDGQPHPKPKQHTRWRSMGRDRWAIKEDWINNYKSVPKLPLRNSLLWTYAKNDQTLLISPRGIKMIDQIAPGETSSRSTKTLNLHEQPSGPWSHNWSTTKSRPYSPNKECGPCLHGTQKE